MNDGKSRHAATEPVPKPDKEPHEPVPSKPLPTERDPEELPVPPVYPTA
jgi:hypothetical protein